MKTDYSNTSMLDIVFEHRNKAYGAYVLRRDYNKSLATAVTITVLSTLVLITGNFIASKLTKGTAGQIFTEGMHDLTEIELPKILEQPKQPEQPQQAQAKQTVENTEKNVVAENQAQSDSIPDADDLKKYDSGLTTNADPGLNNMGIDGGKGNKPTLEPEPIAAAVVAEPRITAEKMPEFPGGEEALMRFLQRNTEYPTMEQDLGVNGKAVIKFVVNEDGSISSAKALKSDSPGFEKEALRVVRKLPKFEPGMQGGKPVKVYFMLPFVWRQTN